MQEGKIAVYAINSEEWDLNPLEISEYSILSPQVLMII